MISQLESLDKRISEVDWNPPKWFKDPQVCNFVLINCNEISLEVFPNQVDFDDRFFRRRWQCHLDPTFEKGNLTLMNEVDCWKNSPRRKTPNRALILTYRHEIAQKLKLRKQNHRFQIGKCYQSRISTKNRKLGWKKGKNLKTMPLYSCFLISIKYL
jgi:hypothetical protein